MMDKNQSQQAGDYSQQMQITNCPITVISGISEKRARDISDEVFNTRIQLTNEAIEIARERVQKLENYLIPRMQKIDALIAFSDPAFQFLLAEAQKNAAKTERPADYELLSELLIRRMEKGSDRNIRAGVSKAVEIVDDISDEALLGLTVTFFLGYYFPTSGKISEGLDILDDMFQKILCDKLPTNSEWLDNLDVLGAVRTSIIRIRPNKYEDFFSEQMRGYCTVGIKKNSANHVKANELLKSVGLPLTIFCDHELNLGYMRLLIANEKSIESLSNMTLGIPSINGVTVSVSLTEEQRRTLHEVYAMYENNGELEKEIYKKLSNELKKRKYINEVQNWWNNLPNSHQITSVGKALAYANLKRIYPNIPQVK